ncbi:MAG: VOC family protein [Saprospiraceae bacterium]|nr:VOC family protein [Saprospiraceae bacterium]
MKQAVDHLVWATPDLETGIEQMADLLGVRPMEGGAHPEFGTRNALLSLGSATYLEIIGPDSEQSSFEGKRWFGIDTLLEPRLVTWAVPTADIYALLERAASIGLDLGEVKRGSRRKPDGATLRWKLTASAELRAGGLIPFFIDWEGSSHPAGSAPAAGSLLSVRAHHPHPQALSKVLSALGIEILVKKAERPFLTAVIQKPDGSEIELK